MITNKLVTKTIKLLNSGNSKTRKGEKRGYITYGLHLAPSDLSGFNVCQFASKGCAAACLNTAGRGVMSSVQRARIAKTKFFFSSRTIFLDQLFHEVRTSIKSAEKKVMIPCFRLNLTSDLPWEKMFLNGKNLMATFPEVQWYDYTKSKSRAIAYACGELSPNYHLTYSRSEETSDIEVKAMLQSGVNVAIVFADSLPFFWEGFPVIDGDSDDLRFLDKRGVIVGLRAKGRGKVDLTGFVLQPEGLIRP
jgi:hypothetical protein